MRQYVHRSLSVLLCLSATALAPAYGQSIGGPARGQRYTTHTTPTTFTAVGRWLALPTARIQYTVPKDTTDVFSVSFSGECTKSGGGSLRIQLVDRSTGAVLAPTSGIDGRVFCSTPDAAATHSAKWIQKLEAGPHDLEVQFWLTDGTAIIDDWVLELVLYD